MEETINEIIECAVKWISADSDNPDTPSGKWQEAFTLLRQAPAMLEVCHAAVDEAGDDAYISRYLDLARAVLVEIEQT